MAVFGDTPKEIKSHPTRGAWIEIPEEENAPPLGKVAPHTGCVD